MPLSEDMLNAQTKDAHYWSFKTSLPKVINQIVSLGITSIQNLSGMTLEIYNGRIIWATNGYSSKIIITEGDSKQTVKSH